MTSIQETVIPSSSLCFTCFLGFMSKNTSIAFREIANYKAHSQCQKKCKFQFYF